MNRIYSVLIVFALFLQACSPGKQIAKRYTADDKTVFDLIDRLKKNPNDAEAAAMLPDAYKQAADVRKNLNASTIANMSEGDRWIEVSKQLMVADQMYSAIKASPAASKAIPNPWSPTLKIQEAKQKAAEEYYNQGVSFMAYNNRPYAEKAYDMFVRANSAYPNYKDVQQMISRADELATIKVLVRPVDYNSYGYNYWGYQNDYLQYKIVRDLNNSSFMHTRFYTDGDLNAQRVQPDRVVELNFRDLNIGNAYTNTNTISRSKQIQTGETKSDPPQPIFTTVKATIVVTSRTLESRASLECRIYDFASGSNILFDRFPDNYTWQVQSARFSGDARALEPEDQRLINNNNGNKLPPSRNELAQRLVDECYNSLLIRIRNGVTF